MNQPRDVDVQQWSLIFGEYVTPDIPLIVPRAGIYFHDSTFIPVSAEWIQLLPQLCHYSTVYPHILQCERQYALVGVPHVRPQTATLKDRRHLFVCATYHATDHNIPGTIYQCHMELKASTFKVHVYTSCTGVHFSSVCTSCGSNFDNKQLLVAHLKKFPAHRNEPVRVQKKIQRIDTHSAVIDNEPLIQSDATDYDIYNQHARAPPQYRPVLVDRTATTAHITPLIRVEQLIVQYTIDGVLYDYVPSQCRKKLFNSVHTADVTTCNIILKGKNEHVVWADPLPYYAQVQNYYCSTHNDTFNCLRHALPPGAGISPDIMAVGGLHTSSIGKPTLIDRSFYCNVITRYTNHFNATSLSNDIQAVWHQNWIRIKQQHNIVARTAVDYIDPGIDSAAPQLYYKLHCIGDTAQQITHNRQHIIHTYGKHCTQAPSADFIDNLFYNHYVPYELKQYLAASTKMAHEWGSECLISDCTFKAVKSVHTYDASNHYHRRGQRNATSRAMVKCVLATLMDLETELVLSARVVPSTECYYVQQQIDTYLQSQQQLPVIERRPLHSVGVDNAVSFGPSILTSIYQSLIQYNLVPVDIQQQWQQQQRHDTNRSYMNTMHIIDFFERYPEYYVYCTEDVFHLKQRVLDKGTSRFHKYIKQWRTHVDTIFAGITKSTYNTMDELKQALCALLHTGSNPTTQLTAMFQHTDATSTDSLPTTVKLYGIYQHRLNQHTLDYEYLTVIDNNNTVQWLTYKQLDELNDTSKKNLQYYLHHKLPPHNRPFLNTSGRRSIQLMINNVRYIYSIILLRKMYPHLQRNSGTNQLESRHSVLNSMKPKKGTTTFQHMLRMIDVRTVQHNIRRLMKLANSIVDSTDVNNAHISRLQRLQHSLLTTFCHVLPPLQSSWYDHDNTWNPPATWLPVHGHPHGCLWRPWLIEPVSFNTVTGEYQFKTYRSKRLGDISGIDVIKMILEFHCYQLADIRSEETNQDVQQLKHHLASKVFNNQRSVDECQCLVDMLAGYALGYATIHNVSNREQDTAAIQSILQFVPVDDNELSTDQTDHIFDTLVKHIRDGVSNRQRIRLLFNHIDLYKQLTIQQIHHGIERHTELDDIVVSHIDHVDTDIADTDMTEQLNDHDNIDIVSDISDCDTEPSTPTKSSSQVQSPSHNTPLI